MERKQRYIAVTSNATNLYLLKGRCLREFSRQFPTWDDNKGYDQYEALTWIEENAKFIDVIDACSY